MKIAILQNISFPKARNRGSENYIRGISISLAKKSFEVSVICHANEKFNNPIEDYVYNNSKIKIIRTPPLNELSISGQLNFMKYVFDILRKQDYDLCHCINPFSSVFPTIVLRKMRRKFFIVYDLRINWIEASYELGYLNFYFMKPILQAIDLVCLKSADKVIAITKKLKSDLERLGVNREKIVISPSGVDLSFFSRANANYKMLYMEKLGIDEDNIIIGYIGAINRKRNLETIIHAFLELKKRISDFKLIFVGFGPDIEYYRKLVEKRDDIIIVGEVPYNELPSWYSLFDIGISVTPTFMAKYSSPLKALEYMAMEVPFIANDVEAYRELGLTEKNCLFFRSGNSKDLQKKMELLVLDEDLRNTFKKENRFFVQKYSWERIVDKVIKNVYMDN